MKIYTRSGDKGRTSLFGGQQVSKAALRIEAYGSVDELNATVGFAESFVEDSEIKAQLKHIQNRLFDVGADLATPQAGASEQTETHVQRTQEAWIGELEDAIDQAQAELEPLANFILPGGAPGAATLHMARTVCRRAERRVVALAQEEDLNPAVVPFLNRLSDLLFVLARLANRRAGKRETVWKSATGGGAAGSD